MERERERYMISPDDGSTPMEIWAHFLPRKEYGNTGNDHSKKDQTHG